MSNKSRSPRLLEEIKSQLLESYPQLHAFVNTGGLIEVAGSYPVRGAGVDVLDRFSISIVLPRAYPQELPTVRETAGRIPWTEVHHVEPDGRACVMLPEDRWRTFPPNARFVDFLDGPLYCYFLGQLHYERRGEWPFGEWGHGGEGIVEFYRELVGTDDSLTALRFLYILGRRRGKGHWECPCGSGEQIKRCCVDLIRELRSKISDARARKSYAHACGHLPAYRGTRLRHRNEWAQDMRRDAARRR